jgi:hypothetical protein
MGKRRGALSIDHRHVMPCPATGCWLWMGSLNSRGYGTFSVSLNGKMHRPHRAFYIELKGPIPEGMQLDHLCRVTSCVNPDHLEPVTNVENKRRGLIARIAEGKVRYPFRTPLPEPIPNHCLFGHEFTPANTRVFADGYRRCRKCIAEHAVEHGKRVRARKLASQEIQS